MKKEIIFGIVGLAAGVGIGVGTTLLVQKLKEPKKELKVMLTKDVPKPEPEPEPTPESDEDSEKEYMEVTPEEFARFKEIVQNEGYGEVDPAENEFPVEEDPEDDRRKIEEWREAHKDVIEVIDEEEFSYENDFPQDDFDREELFYFPDEYLLTDEDGNDLEPISAYCGKIIDRYSRELLPRLVYGSESVSNDAHFINVYIRNYPLEKKFKVRIPVRWYQDLELGKEVFDLVSRDEFFG